MWHKFQWLMLAVVRPIVGLFIIINGLPPSVRAVFSGLSQLVKAIKGNS